MTKTQRNLFIAAGIVLWHAAALWALQAGLLRRAVEVIVPVEVLSELIEPPTPRPAPPPPAAPTPPARPAPPASPKPAPAAPLPQPVQPSTEPAPSAAVNAPSMPAATAPSAPVAPASAKVELPSSNAQYLQNPKPPYPALSKRLGEQGKVVVRVLVGVDGSAQQGDIQQSSGFDRLDQAALTTVLRWRFVPGKRGGVPEAMWFNVPIEFKLE